MTGLQASSQEELRRVIDRLERLSEEIAELKADFNDTLKNAGQKGFDTKIIRKVLAIRKKDAAERSEEEALIQTYCHALGMQGSFEFEPSRDAAPMEVHA